MSTPNDLYAPHPVMPLPSLTRAQLLGPERLRDYLVKRREAMRREVENPLVYGYEPPIWRVCYALAGHNPHVGTPREDAFAAWSKRMREHLTFDRPVRAILALGGNRTAKTEMAAKMMMQDLLSAPDRRAWAFHETEPMSVDVQQKRVFKFFPPELRDETVRSKKEYISFTGQNGFSGNKFTLHNLSDARFRFYGQGVESLQGDELDYCWCDELMPLEFDRELRFRVATRDGLLLITYTPIHGHNPTTQLYVKGAKVVKEIDAFMLPKDGGPWDIARTLGFESDEAWKEAQTKHGKNPIGPLSIPEDCDKWLTGERSQPAVPPGRQFHRLPRVLKCHSENPDDTSAVVYFNSMDNPFGNPASVISKAINDRANTDQIKIRVYGFTVATAQARFSKFREEIHVVPAKSIPPAKDGTNYQVMDPAGHRPYTMLWARAVKHGIYIYREWPCPRREVIGYGFPGPWAVNGKDPDGVAGPAQKMTGLSYLDYKREIAEAEGWEGYKRGISNAELLKLRPAGGENVRVRFIDPRAAGTEIKTLDGVKTLLTSLDDIGLFFEPAPGDDIDDGCAEIDNWLAYDTEREIDFSNRPKLYISDECENLIFALKTWVGWRRPADGNTGAMNMKGATKDFIDKLRYLALAGIDYVPEASLGTVGGGYY